MTLPQTTYGISPPQFGLNLFMRGQTHPSLLHISVDPDESTYSLQCTEVHKNTTKKCGILYTALLIEIQICVKWAYKFYLYFRTISEITAPIAVIELYKKCQISSLSVFVKLTEEYLTPL